MAKQCFRHDINRHVWNMHTYSDKFVINKNCNLKNVKLPFLLLSKFLELGHG